MRLLLRQGVRHHRRHPLQTLLTLFGIAVGTAMACAMQLAQGTAERAFDRAIEIVAGTSTHTATAGPDGIELERCAALRARLGGRGIAPSITAVVRVPGPAQRTVLRAFGVDPLADAELRPWASANARTGARPLPVADLMTVPGAFLATSAVLARLGTKAGGELPITVAGRPFVARCFGALPVAGDVEKGLDDVLVVDLATAQEWTGRTTSVDRVELRLAPELLPDGMDERTALALAAEQLGPGVRIVESGARSGGLSKLARGFRINVRALSLLSLLVGAFLVHETMRLSVVARRRSFGVLRALGARGPVLGLVVASEAALLGLVGSVAGAVLGTLLAQVLLDPLVRTLNDHYATFELHGVELDVSVLAVSTLLGTLVALLAALGPAIAASRVPPREVLVAHAAAPVARRWRAPVVGAVAALCAWLCLSTTGDRLIQGYFGTLAMMVAAVAFVPSALGALLAVAAALVRRAGPFVRYVVRSTAAARDHLAMPVAAMVLALASTIGLATLVGSFRTSVAEWLGQVLPADVYVMVPGGVDERPRSAIAPEIVATLRGAPDVAEATTYQRTLVRVRAGRGDDDVEIVGMDPTERVKRGFPFVAGDDVAGRESMVRGESAWVSEPLAFRFGLAVGDPVTVTTARGPATLPVGGIYRDYSNERGEVIVGKVWFDAHLTGGVTAVSLHVREGSDVDAVVADLRRRAADAADQDVQIRSQRHLREGSLAIFDRSFAITGVMRLLCLIVAFFGICSAFASLQLERGNEIGLLRCLGARRSQIGGIVLGQTAVLGACAGVLALPVGALLGHVLAAVINKVSFGWSLPVVQVPVAAAGEVVVLAIVAAVLAGVQPAFRFARMRPAEVLREA